MFTMIIFVCFVLFWIHLFFFFTVNTNTTTTNNLFNLTNDIYTYINQPNNSPTTFSFSFSSISIVNSPTDSTGSSTSTARPISISRS